ncbi:MAG: amino acid adenylation domain-containing protein [Chloroflexi bacterium]|nr:amino acid adenylation domain-containing protein [Chloroflexota bacterium]
MSGISFTPGDVSYPSAAALFEQVVARQTEAAAIESAERSFTYDDLNRAANRIARAIVAGCGSDEEPVLLLFGKNALVAAAMLGILKAGKFYVPLDAADPAARLRLIAQDAGARLVLTDTEHEVQARALAGEAAIFNVDTIDPGADDRNLDLDIASSRMAYVTYTSGSTGAPKGIQHNQHTLVKTALVREQLGFSTATDRTALLYSLSVVQSTQYLFAALLNGGAACVYDLQAQGLAGLAEWMRRNRITAFISTPTVYRHFVATLDGRADMPHLRLISLAGEPVLAHDVALYQRCFEAPCRLRISYGSTEAPVSAEWVADQRTRLAQPHAPGGYAWGGSRIFIRDAQGRPLPPGEVGEIVVQSDLLSTGYWQRPELTAQSFLPDPAGGERRLFRTGDLGTLSPDGLLEFYGRKDNQVKVRGHRVEPAEIEDALFALDGVRQAAVLPQAAPGGETRLIAYLVSDGALPDAAVLRARLAARLPAHMLPAVFVRLLSMPVNEAGKVDRRALPPAPELERSTADPADEEIGRMLAIWREVFGAPVGLDDHFVELGGHSLIAARIVVRVSAEFGTPVDVTALAQAPTAAQLARWMRSPTPAASHHTVLALLRAGGQRPPFFCVHGFVGGVLDYGPLARHLDADQPFYALQSPAFDGQTPPQDNLVAMATEYASAIRAVQPRGPYRLGGYCFGGVVAFEMAQQLRAQGESVALLAMIEGYTPRAAMTPRHWTNSQHLAAFAANLPYWWRDVTRPGARAAVGRIVQRRRHAGGSASRVIDDALQGVEVPDTLVHIMQAHVDAMRCYKPGSYDGTITLFRVRGQSLWRAHDPTMGWGGVAASVRIRTIAGTHNTVLAEPDVRSLAASLSAALDDGSA